MIQYNINTEKKSIRLNQEGLEKQKNGHSDGDFDLP